MLEPSEIPRIGERHEDVFLARYGHLRVWALRLTEGDKGRAEDLVHDAFIQFTFTRPELERVQNLDGYLYQMLRNLNISQMRRARRRREDAPAVVEYDSAEFVLRATDPRDLIRVQDDLRQVCQYACLRKETSKAGSVLILRFMHGYYPSEIAQVMGASREAVEERLRIARGEARQFLKDPSSLRFIAKEGDRAKSPAAATGFAQTHDELLADLRRRVFDSRRGDCLTAGQLAHIYRGDEKDGPDCATLAHVVSCPRCIDEVNRLHCLTPLSERHPADALGHDARRKGSGGGGDDSDGPGDGDGGSGAASDEEARGCVRRARDVFEHRPRELCVAVNGRLLAAQKVGAALNEQKLSVGTGGEVNFVEVFSEQDVRLLYLDAALWPVGEDGARTASVGLSDRRTLEARLTYVDSAPTLQVVYRDPLMASEPVRQHERIGEGDGQVGDATEIGGHREGAGGRKSSRPRLHATAWRWLLKLLGRLAGLFTVFRPGAVAAGLSLLVVAALLFTKLYVPEVSATELLRRAEAAEVSVEASSPGLVLHRTVFVEEAKSDGRGGVVSRRRVETWQGGASRIRLRRLYDEQGRLVAGEWTKSDGTTTVYRRGSPPSEAGAATAKELLDAGEVWRIEPSARSFSTLRAGADALKVEDKLGAYVVGYDAAASGADKLLGAALWLTKADLHAFRMTLVVRRDGAAVEYRLIEGGFERRRAEDVPPDIYRLDPELLEASQGKNDEADRAKAQGGEDAHPSSLIPHPLLLRSWKSRWHIF